MKHILKGLVFYPLAGMLYFISLLPLPLLYGASSAIFYLICYVVKYRRSVVRENLIRSFPDLPLPEIISIEKKYYRHLTDLLVEGVWALTASGRQIQRRCRFENIEALDDHCAQGRDVIVIMGHLGNWEWSGLSMSVSGRHKLRALYRPLKDPFFNRFFLRFRSRLGGQMIPMQQAVRYMIARNEQPVCTTFIADQTPPPETALWTEFLHQDTPFFTGYDAIARKFQLPVVMAIVKKKKRGYYTIRLETMAENAGDLESGRLVRMFAHRLEKAIQEQPAYWLWSHRRWKHKRKKEDRDQEK